MVKDPAHLDAAPGGLEDPPVGGRAVPLDVRAEQPDQDRGMGMVRVSLPARCFRPRSWREVPSSVQARPARDAVLGWLIHALSFVVEVCHLPRTPLNNPGFHE